MIKYVTCKESPDVRERNLAKITFSFLFFSATVTIEIQLAPLRGDMTVELKQFFNFSLTFLRGAVCWCMWKVSRQGTG